jgi:hypothetical protein
MAMGIDDALAAAAAGISLADTCVETIKKFRKQDKDLDIERLVEEVRITAMARLDDADQALVQLERLLIEKNVDLKQPLSDAIAKTPWWRPDETHRLKRIQRSFNSLADATYSAADDIASLVRCRNRTEEMGPVVVQSANAKRSFEHRLTHAGSIGEKISVLKAELDRQAMLIK